MSAFEPPLVETDASQTRKTCFSAPRLSKTQQLLDGAEDFESGCHCDILTAPEICKVLIVDDNRMTLRLLEKQLESVGAKLTLCQNGAEALAAAAQDEFALAILDVHMPEMDGFELLQQIRLLPTNRLLPVVFLSASYENEVSVFKGYDLGAVDFLSKPCNVKILRSKVEVFLELHKQKRELQRLLKELEHSKQVIVQQNQLLRGLVNRDELTGLHNRRYFREILSRLFAVSKTDELPLSFLMLDIDLFKKINDEFGHDFGDKVLVQFSDTLLTSIRATDLAFRLGGEEFGVILPETNEAGAVLAAERIQTNIRQLCVLKNTTQVSVTVSIGVSERLKLNAQSENELYRRADAALYHSKNTGRNRLTRASSLVTLNTAS